MPGLKKLHKEWDHVLEDVWDQWNAPVWREGGPFFNLSSVPDLDNDPRYCYSVGWIKGVSQATGWDVTAYGKRKGIRTHVLKGWLKNEFKQALEDIWGWYDEYTEGKRAGSPFINLEDVSQLHDYPAFNYSIGWARGVSQATEWPVDRITGPREWSPRW